MRIHMINYWIKGYRKAEDNSKYES